MKTQKNESHQVVIPIIVTLLVAVMDISGYPISLFVYSGLWDIDALYIARILNHIFIILCFIFFKLAYPHWIRGLSNKNTFFGLVKYGAVGVIAFTVSLIAFYIGLSPLDRIPSFAKVMTECVIYYFFVALIEELYIRGLLLNIFRKMFRKNSAVLAVIASSVIFGIGHIPGSAGQPLLAVVSKVVWTISLGLYLGTVYVKTGNLKVAVILHYVVDLCALPYCFSTQTGYPKLSLYIILPLFVLMGIYSIYLLLKDKQELLS